MLLDIQPNCRAVDHYVSEVSLPIAAGHHAVEDVREVVFRAAAENGFRHTKDVLGFAGFGACRKLSALSSFDHVGDIARLRSVLGTKADLGRVRGGVSNPIESSRDWVNFIGAAVRRSFLSPWRRVSPRRLQQTPVLHAMWAIKPFEFDLVTRELLIGECPRCNAKLTWDWAEDVTLCGACALRGETCDMREFCQPLVDFEDEAGVHLVADQLDPESAHRRAGYQLHADLRDLSRGQVFHLAVKIAAALSAANPAEGLPASAIGRAGRAILRWPNGFEDLLDQDALSNGAVRRACVSSRPLSRLTTDQTIGRTLRLRIIELLARQRRKEVFGMRERLALGISMPSRGPRSEILKLEANLRLAVPQALRRMTAGEDEAHIVAVIVRDIKRCRVIADDLGLPSFELLQLYENGMLPELHEDLDHIACKPVGGAGTLVAIREKTPGPDTGIPLIRAASLMRGRNDVPWAEVLAAITNGTINVTRGSQQGDGILGSLWTNDWERLRNVVSSKYRSPFLYTAVTHREAARTMGIDSKIVADAVKHGVLPDNLTLWDITRIRAFWMFSFEVKDLFKVNNLSVTSTFRRLHSTRFERFSTKNFSLWRRSNVYSFLSQCVTQPQLPGTAMVL